MNTAVKHESFEDNTVIYPENSPVGENTPDLSGQNFKGDVNQSKAQKYAEAAGQNEENVVEDRQEDPDLDTFDNGKVFEKNETQTQKLPEQNEDTDAAEKVAKNPEDKSDDDVKEPVKEPETEEKEPEIASKKIRVKTGGKYADIDQESTVRVKVKGKNEYVSLQDLKNSYSGDRVITDELAQVRQDRELFKGEKEQYQQERNELAGNLSDIGKILDNPERNPFDALHYLVDKSGRNPIEFQKKVISFMSKEIEHLSELDDTERELYWMKQENEMIRNNRAADAEKLKATETRTEQIVKVDRLRESLGVTEDQFVDSYEELETLGYSKKQITPEMACNYAVMKPFYTQAEDLTKEFTDDLSDDDMDSLIKTVADTKRNMPALEDQKILKYSLDQLGWEYTDDNADLQELNNKVPANEADPVFRSQRAAEDRKHARPESFDDFDDDENGVHAPRRWD